MIPQRGCGHRVRGGLYLEIPTASSGQPIEYFLLDPPKKIRDLEVLNNVSLSPRGVTLFAEPESEKEHIIDIVGRSHYPNVADFVEETRRFGLSRRLSRRLNLEGIGPDSWLFLVHDRAWVENMQNYQTWKCPSMLPYVQALHHPRIIAPGVCCAGVWWQDIDPGSKHRVLNGRQIKRQMPSFEYSGYLRPQGIEPAYERAVFMRFPLQMARLAIVQGEGADESLRAAEKSQLPVVEVEE